MTGIRLDVLLSTIILVAFLATILMAIASYAAYKLRERRRPRVVAEPSNQEVLFFERILADRPPGDDVGES